MCAVWQTNEIVIRIGNEFPYKLIDLVTRFGSHCKLQHGVLQIWQMFLGAHEQSELDLLRCQFKFKIILELCFLDFFQFQFSPLNS